MGRAREILLAFLAAFAVALTLGAGTAEAKKRKVVRVPVTINMAHVPGGGLDQLSGSVVSPFTRCAQFVQVLFVKQSGTSAFGPFTPSIQFATVDSGPPGTYQLLFEPSFVPPYTVERYTAQTTQKKFKTRRKTVVCRAGASLPVNVLRPADD